MAAVAQTARRDAIRGLWPDKLLYASIMLFVTGLVGVLHAGVEMLLDITYSENLPGLFQGWPASTTLVLSALTVGFAFAAIQRVDPRWAVAGAVAGLLSLSLFGLGSVLSLLAIGFLVASRMEGEDMSEATLRLSPEEWPDKSLAASLLLLLTGVVTGGWGIVVLAGGVEFGSEQATPIGLFQLAVGLVCLASAFYLYHQRAPKLGLAAGLLGILGIGAYVLGPLLSLAALAALAMANRENEFDLG